MAVTDDPRVEPESLTTRARENMALAKHLGRGPVRKLVRRCYRGSKQSQNGTVSAASEADADPAAGVLGI